VNFNRNWTDYEKGFGDLNIEFWYRLEELHYLMQRGQWEMRVDYQKNDKTWSYLQYNNFSVGSAKQEYPLTVGGFTGVGTNYSQWLPLLLLPNSLFICLISIKEKSEMQLLAIKEREHKTRY